MGILTVGDIRRGIAGLRDDDELCVRVDLTRSDGRHITRAAELASLEAHVGEGTLFDFVDITLSASLAPDDPLWGLVEDGVIIEEDYWEMVAK